MPEIRIDLPDGNVAFYSPAEASRMRSLSAAARMSGDPIEPQLLALHDLKTLGVDVTAPVELGPPGTGDITVTADDIVHHD